jgi:hypothetical protein
VNDRVKNHLFLRTSSTAYYITKAPSLGSRLFCRPQQCRREGKAGRNYRGPTTLRMLSSFSIVSLFVDLQINHFRPSPGHSTTDSHSDLVQRYVAGPPFWRGGEERFFFPPTGDRTHSRRPLSSGANQSDGPRRQSYSVVTAHLYMFFFFFFFSTIQTAHVFVLGICESYYRNKLAWLTVWYVHKIFFLSCLKHYKTTRNPGAQLRICVSSPFYNTHSISTEQIPAVIKHRASITPSIPIHHRLQSFLAKPNKSTDIYNPQVKMNAAFKNTNLFLRRETAANATQWPHPEQHNKLNEWTVHSHVPSALTYAFSPQTIR